MVGKSEYAKAACVVSDLAGGEREGGIEERKKEDGPPLGRTEEPRKDRSREQRGGADVAGREPTGRRGSG